MKKISLLLFCLAFSFLSAQVNRIEPPNWWTGFKNENLQLLVQHPNIGAATPKISYPGVSIIKVNQAKSPNYLFIDIAIDKSASTLFLNLKKVKK
jgi:hypothetical protein